ATSGSTGVGSAGTVGVNVGAGSRVGRGGSAPVPHAVTSKASVRTASHCQRRVRLKNFMRTSPDPNQRVECGLRSARTQGSRSAYSTLDWTVWFRNFTVDLSILPDLRLHGRLYGARR